MPTPLAPTTAILITLLVPAHSVLEAGGHSLIVHMFWMRRIAPGIGEYSGDEWGQCRAACVQGCAAAAPAVVAADAPGLPLVTLLQFVRSTARCRLFSFGATSDGSAPSILKANHKVEQTEGPRPFFTLLYQKAPSAAVIVLPRCVILMHAVCGGLLLFMTGSTSPGVRH